jgi:IS5 family transposase
VRCKVNLQEALDFEPSNLKVTSEYYRRYETISRLLDENPAILDRIHRDLRRALRRERQRDRAFVYTSDQALRILVAQICEGESLRGIVVRVDDSWGLRRFTRVHHGPMMDYTTLCRLKNAIRPKTWSKVNELLTGYAIEKQRIGGDELRLDTTAVETNIHFPTDSTLLWDTYRVLGRLVNRARAIDPEAVGKRRLQSRKAKRLAVAIARRTRRQRRMRDREKDAYAALFGLVEALLAWAAEVCAELQGALRENLYESADAIVVEAVARDLAHYLPLGRRVLDQARRRIEYGEVVPAQDKLYSLFEPETQLLVRGKAQRHIEFGHMVLLEQVRGNFITGYEVFSQKTMEASTVDPVLRRHERRFGTPPAVLAADKAFYESMPKLRQLEERVELVAIGKMGRRTDAERQREQTESYKRAQRFRAGIEGTISFAKRCLRLARCFNKGYRHFVATVCATVFAHNLVVLARGYG